MKGPLGQSQKDDGCSGQAYRCPKSLSPNTVRNEVGSDEKGDDHTDQAFECEEGRRFVPATGEAGEGIRYKNELPETGVVIS